MFVDIVCCSREREKIYNDKIVLSWEVQHVLGLFIDKHISIIRYLLTRKNERRSTLGFHMMTCLPFWPQNVFQIWTKIIQDSVSRFRICKFISWWHHFKDVSLGIPKSDLLGVTVAFIHGAAHRFLAVWKCLNHRRDSKDGPVPILEGNLPYSCEIRVLVAVIQG